MEILEISWCCNPIHDAGTNINKVLDFLILTGKYIRAILSDTSSAEGMILDFVLRAYDEKQFMRLFSG